MNNLTYFAAYVANNAMPDYRSYLSDPTTPGSKQPVLKVTYKAGAWSPNAAVQGGMLWHAYPYGKNVQLASMGATLEYDVYFPPDFDWVKGGKLPGLTGGNQGCGGGIDAVTCWSVRIMWRRKGAGEAYMYLPPGKQPSDFCDNVNGTTTICDDAAGTSFRRGAFYFTPGAWHNIRLAVKLNPVGEQAGTIQVDVNGETKIFYDRVVYRTVDTLRVNSLYMASWFGGSDASWAPSTDTYALFKNFRVYTSDGVVTAERVPLQSVPLPQAETMRIPDPEDPPM